MHIAILAPLYLKEARILQYLNTLIAQERHTQVLRAMCEGCSPSWLRAHASTITRALDCPSIWESRDPRLSTQIARCAGQLAESCGSLLLDDVRSHLLRIVIGLQVEP
jgi:hypothetical protein